jgi:hypothetical protein
LRHRSYRCICEHRRHPNTHATILNFGPTTCPRNMANQCKNSGSDRILRRVSLWIRLAAHSVECLQRFYRRTWGHNVHMRSSACNTAWRGGDFAASSHLCYISLVRMIDILCSYNLSFHHRIDHLTKKDDYKKKGSTQKLKERGRAGKLQTLLTSTPIHTSDDTRT